MKNILITILVLLLVPIFGCQSIEPKILKAEDRIKPPYNLLLLKEIDGDTTFDYKWSNDSADEGYLGVGTQFIKAYETVMKEVDEKGEKLLVDVYKSQKDEIVARFKQNGEKIAAVRERSLLDSFTKVILDETESIVETGDEFSIVNDISIKIPKIEDDTQKTQPKKDDEKTEERQSEHELN